MKKGRRERVTFRLWKRGGREEEEEGRTPFGDKMAATLRVRRRGPVD